MEDNPGLVTGEAEELLSTLEREVSNYYCVPVTRKIIHPFLLIGEIYASGAGHNSEYVYLDGWLH